MQELFVRFQTNRKLSYKLVSSLVAPGLVNLVHTLSNVCSVHRRMFSTSGGVHYIGDTMSTSGDILSTSGDVQFIGGYHDSCGGASS